MKRLGFEDVGGDFGFRCQWIYDGHRAEVVAYQIMGRDHIDQPLFGHECADAEPTEGTPKYLDGFVKWDGCSQFIFEQGEYQHLCGADSYHQHIQLLRYIWRRAFDLMGRDEAESFAASGEIVQMEWTEGEEPRI